MKREESEQLKGKKEKKEKQLQLIPQAIPEVARPRSP